MKHTKASDYKGMSCCQRAQIVIKGIKLGKSDGFLRNIENLVKDSVHASR